MVSRVVLRVTPEVAAAIRGESTRKPVRDATVSTTLSPT
jgi:hypothetical protein